MLCNTGVLFHVSYKGIKNFAFLETLLKKIVMVVLQCYNIFKLKQF